MTKSTEQLKLTPEILLRAYSIGLFPMAEHSDDPDIYWLDPKQRGIFPLDGLNISRSLAKKLRQDLFKVTINHDFAAVIAACATPRGQDGETWINSTIRQAYLELHRCGHAHSVEVWLDNKLVGGLYGVSIASAFCGESMFHRVADASKVALVYLVAQLRQDSFTLLDTQFITPHLESLGAIEISRQDYLSRLRQALLQPAVFAATPVRSGKDALQLATTGRDQDC
eukprot:gene19185-19557_t